MKTNWPTKKLGEYVDQGLIELSRGNVISRKDIQEIPGSYPVYSSSIQNQGLFGRYGRYMFDEELITWSVDGGGNFFYRPKHKFSVTNVVGILRIRSKALIPKFLYYLLYWEHSQLDFDYVKKAHPSVIRNLYFIARPPRPEQKKIVYILDSIQEAVKAQERIIGKTKELKKAMMKKLFTEGIHNEGLKETKIGKTPKSWEIIEFGKALDSKANHEVGELKQKDFQQSGQFPIVDQSEALISGYSDDSEKVYNGVLPAIIFGDHTRVVKYVDFSFIAGGSGVKILIPSKEFDILFFFYVINNLNLSSRGYNRHFKLLKEKFIPKPKLSEQREIAEILQTIDQKIEIEQKKRALYEELFKSMLNKLMTGEIRVDNLEFSKQYATS